MRSPISSISFSWFFHISFIIRLKNQFLSSIIFLAVAELLLLLIFIQFFCRLDNCSIIELHIWWLFDFSFAKLTIFSEVFLSVLLIFSHDLACWGMSSRLLLTSVWYWSRTLISFARSSVLYFMVFLLILLKRKLLVKFSFVTSKLQLLSQSFFYKLWSFAGCTHISPRW